MHSCQNIITVNLMIVEILENVTVVRMKSEHHSVLHMISNQKKTERLLFVIEILWNRNELRLKI